MQRKCGIYTEYSFEMDKFIQFHFVFQYFNKQVYSITHVISLDIFMQIESD